MLVGWTQVSRHPQRSSLLELVLAAHAASLLEVLDFPPLWGVLDAHSLWHACTPALTLGWWRFLEADLDQWGPRKGSRIA